MKVKILKNTMADKKYVKAGETHDIPDRDANYLIAIKKAELVKDEPKAEKIEEKHEEIEAPQPKKKKK